MRYETIAFDVDDMGVGRLFLNRPQNFNAFNKEMVKECVEILGEMNRNQDLRVLVITGAGDAFSAGGDISWLLDSREVLQKKEIMDYTTQLMMALDRIKRPIIASVNGVAAGAGTAIVLACDIIVASENAKFAPNFVSIGAVPDSGCSWFLPRKVGYHRACELLFTGRILSAPEAYEMGIFNTLVPSSELEKATMRLAEKLAGGPLRALEYIKAMLKMSYKNDLRTQLDIEAYYQVMAWSDSDFLEGVQAFFEKRKPNFKR